MSGAAALFFSPRALRIVVAAALALNLATGLFQDFIDAGAQAALIALTLVLFAFIHGERDHGLRGVALFAVLALVLSNLIENIGVATGFPFGRYHYAGMLGPKLFYVPLTIGWAWFGLGYLSFALARLILDADAKPVALALVAAAILTAFDFAADPVLSTARQAWIWHEGGAFFGVPALNFFGWFATGFAIFFSFARMRPAARPSQPTDRFHRLAPIMLYAGIAGMMALAALTVNAPGAIADASGATWRARDLYAASGLVALVAMGPFALIALFRATKRDHSPPNHSSHGGSRRV